MAINMKFREFLLRRLLKGTDYLVGYDASTGEYIRISKADLASSIAAIAAAQTLAVQYSANGESWHDSYTAGDNYMRIKTGSGAWSGAIRICVSAYDIWLQAGNSGSEADFLASLKGENGDGADLSGLQLQNIAGYAEFLQNVNASIANAKAAIIEEVKTEAAEQVMAQFTGLQLSDITEVRSLSDDDYLTIVTSDGLRKVRIGSLSDSVAVRTVSTTVVEQSLKTQLEILGITGQQNGVNKDFIVSKNYVSGSSMLFLNGQRVTPALDYKEVPGGFKMLTDAPESDDILIFQAVAR